MRIKAALLFSWTNFTPLKFQLIIFQNNLVISEIKLKVMYLVYCIFYKHA